MKSLATCPTIRTPNPDFENHIVMWMEKFGRQIQATRDMPDCELLFVGDSITEHYTLEAVGLPVWERYYARRKAVNAGSGGDSTEHILWRLNNGIFEQITPKLVVLLAGTNNTGHRMDPPREICDGVETLVRCIHENSPQSRILLLAIFPCGRDGSDPCRRNNEAANLLIEKMAVDYPFVEFKDINSVFLDERGILSDAIMPDLLHPSTVGYTLWADAIESRVEDMLAEA